MRDLEPELKSWVCENKKERERKAEREFCRYPKLIKEMGLDFIRTDNKVALDIGCGPRGILHDLDAKIKVGLDPLIDEYNKYFDLSFFTATINSFGEDIPLRDNSIDLVTSVNNLDHCKFPQKVIDEIRRVLKPSGYLGVHFCINLAKNHPHDSHTINLNPEDFHKMIDSDFETVHEVKFPELRYGWIKYKGKVGQPALAGLYRLTTKGG